MSSGIIDIKWTEYKSYKMSLFKKPKKSLQNRRMFSSEIENMDVDDDEPTEAEIKQKKKDKRDKELASKPQKSSLLSFGDEGI